MRKFLILFGVIFLLLGIRLHYNWIATAGLTGELTVYHKGGEITEYGEQFPLLLNSNETVRLDIKGGRSEAESVLKSLKAKTLWIEDFDNLTIIYAYSSDIYDYRSILGEKVNLMIAINDDGVAIGSPILKGSY